jgi:EmrB/QacA subfamily drug resistance transporter
MTGTLLAMFLSTVYMTVMSTAMPHIITDLGGFSMYSWVFTAYFLAEVTSILLAGKLSDMYGRKWFYVAYLGFFILGSLLSGISQSMAQLITFRVIQGIGGGGMMALSVIVIADLFPPQERGKWQGVTSFVMAASTLVGPTLGGYITDYLSWRWCFFINIPAGGAVAILFIFFYPSMQTASDKRKIDFTGSALTVLLIVPLMLALTWGGVDYPWHSPVILGLLGFSLAMIILFIVVESRAEEPIMPLKLFKNRTVLVSILAVLFMGIGFSPIIEYIPLYYQGVLGTSASTSGNSVMPMLLGVALSSFICGQILSRTGGYYRLQASIGFIMMGIGLYLLSEMTVNTSLTYVIGTTIMIGIGCGFLFPVHTLAVQNTVPYSIMGTATSVLTWFRTFGNLIGLSFAGSIMNSRFSAQFTANLSPEIKEVVSPEELSAVISNPQALISPEAQTQMLRLFAGMGSRGEALLQELLSTLQIALNNAMTYMYAILIGAVIAGFVANLFLKGIPRYKSSKSKRES